MKQKRTSLRKNFLRYLCQTSHDPMGIEVDYASGSSIVDIQGKSYLDFISGIGVANVGHRHPQVLKAIADQAKRYLHVMVYGEFIQAPQVQLAGQLARIAPKPLSVTYFTNSGTEAVEGSLKTAKKATGRKKIIAFTGSFHGDSQGALSVTGRSAYRLPFLPLLPHVRFLPFNDRKNLEKIDNKTAAVIIEPIQSEGGVNLPDKDFLQELRKRCNLTGTVLIFDEVMTGLGRTGLPFACNHWKVVPDILILAKSLGGGMPLGAFLGRPELMKTLSENPALSHVTTFGGHPVSCAAGLAALKILMDQRLDKQALLKGKRFMRAFQSWKKNLGGIRDIRGKGLLIGLELHSKDLCRRFVEHCRRKGLILGWTLHSDTVIRLAPPLVIMEKEIDQGLEIMFEALKDCLHFT